MFPCEGEREGLVVVVGGEVDTGNEDLCALVLARQETCLYHTGAKACDDKARPVGKATAGVEVAEEHDGETNFEEDAMRREAFWLEGM